MNIKYSLINICNKIIESGLIFLIIFTPSAFGSVHPWAYSIMGCISFSLVIVWLIKLIIKNENQKSTLSSFNLLLIPLALFLGLILFQLTPLSPGMLHMLSPNTFDLYKLTLADYSFSEKSLGNYRTLSIYPYLTKTMFLQLLSCISIYIVITNNFRFKKFRKGTLRSERENQDQDFYIDGERFIKAIIFTGFTASFLGLLQYFSGTEKIYFLRDASYASPFGPYINRNHFAGYINLTIPLLLALLISNQKNNSILYNQKNNSRFFIKNMIVSVDPWIRNNGFNSFSLVLMISCLFLSASKGGFLSFWISMATFSVIIFAGKRHTKIHISTKTILIIFISTLFMTLLWSDLRPVLTRFSQLNEYLETIDLNYRTLAYIDAWKMSRDFPLFGIGLGGFEILFFKYRSMKAAEIASTSYSSTHSDYLQLLTDTGSLGCIMISIFILVFFSLVIVKHHKERDPFTKLLTAGGFSGVISMCCHSFVDFNMQIPANVLHLFIIVGITQISFAQKIK